MAVRSARLPPSSLGRGGPRFVRSLQGIRLSAGQGLRTTGKEGIRDTLDVLRLDASLLAGTLMPNHPPRQKLVCSTTRAAFTAVPRRARLRHRGSFGGRRTLAAVCWADPLTWSLPIIRQARHCEAAIARRWYDATTFRLSLRRTGVFDRSAAVQEVARSKKPDSDILKCERF